MGVMAEDGAESLVPEAALATVNEAVTHFTTRMMPRLWTGINGDTKACEQDDELLAAFVRAHPMSFELGLPDYIDRLAASGSSDPRTPSALSMLLEAAMGDPRFKSTLASINAAVGLNICSSALFRHFNVLTPMAREYAQSLATMFQRRLTGEDRSSGDFAPELRDSDMHRSDLPDVLPEDLDGMSVKDIETMIEAYVRAPIQAVETRLRPGALSDSGFLAPGERLGEVIWEDARTLHELGVRRQALVNAFEQAVALFELRNDRYALEHAARLAEMSPEPSAMEIDFASRLDTDFRRSRQDKLDQIERISPNTFAIQAQLAVSRSMWLGHQQEPFHTLPWFGVNLDYKVCNPKLGPGGEFESNLLSSRLVRRFCFFQGHVPHRLDPESAARVLGLLS
jgi:hypothetical protein